MKPFRIVRSKYLLQIIFFNLVCLMIVLGYVLQGYLPFGPFGEPDPVVIFLPIIIDAFICIFWFRSYLLLITDKVFTIRGLLRVHSRDPIAVFDPLNYVKFNKISKLSAAAKEGLAKMVLEKYGEDVEPEQKHMQELLLPIIRNFRDTEYQKYLGCEKYDHLVHGVMLMEYREDGGNRAFGKRGARANGNAVLVNPAGMVRNYGSDAICYTNVENYWGIDLFGYSLQNAPVDKDAEEDLTNDILRGIKESEEPELAAVTRYPGLPHYILFGVLDHNPWFKLGDHMVCYGTEPLHQCVRALVEDNETVIESELSGRPRYIWGFPATTIDIDPKERLNYINDLKTKVTKSITDTAGNYDVVKKVEEKATGKESEPPAEPVSVDEDGEDEE